MYIRTQIDLQEQCEKIESELQIVKGRLLDANTDNGKMNEKIAELKLKNVSLNVILKQLAAKPCEKYIRT